LLAVSKSRKVEVNTPVSQRTLQREFDASFWFSCQKRTKGRLVININNLILPNGEPLYFTNTDVRIYGKNRTPLAVALGIFVWPCIFIPGSKAVLPAGYEVQATVATNTTINAE
jgi:hypothetical protein